MSDLPLPSFPADAADRSFYLGHIWKRVEKTEVVRLVAPESIDLWSVNLYWDTRPAQRPPPRLLLGGISDPGACGPGLGQAGRLAQVEPKAGCRACGMSHIVEQHLDLDDV